MISEYSELLAACRLSTGRRCYYSHKCSDRFALHFTSLSATSAVEHNSVCLVENFSAMAQLCEQMVQRCGSIEALPGSEVARKKPQQMKHQASSQLAQSDAKCK